MFDRLLTEFVLPGALPCSYGFYTEKVVAFRQLTAL